MEAFYRTRDGYEFKTYYEAVKHESMLVDDEMGRLRDNLETYLSNKNAIKAYHMKRAESNLSDAWGKFSKLVSHITRYDFCDEKKVKEFYDAADDVEKCAIDVNYFRKKLAEAKNKIRCINAALKMKTTGRTIENLLVPAEKLRTWW